MRPATRSTLCALAAASAVLLTGCASEYIPPGPRPLQPAHIVRHDPSKAHQQPNRSPEDPCDVQTVSVDTGVEF